MGHLHSDYSSTTTYKEIMSVWEQYRAEGRYMDMLMSTTKNLSMMKTWVMDTGLIPKKVELDEGLKEDLWGILTPSRNKAAKESIIVDDDDEYEDEIEIEIRNENGNKNREQIDRFSLQPMEKNN